MAEIGVNVALDGRHSPELVSSLGATWVRIVATPDHDLSDYFRACQAAGVRVLLVLARESGGNYAEYRRRYDGLMNAVQVGNEPDGLGESSWTMTQAELASLGRMARRVWPDLPMLAGGLVSGNPSWLDGCDLSWADRIAVHPYTHTAGDVHWLLDAYRAYGKRLVVTEWGWPSEDESEAAGVIGDMAAWAASQADIDLFFHFCISDGMVPPFGLLRADGSWKPSAFAFQNAAVLQQSTGWPPPASEPSPAPPPFDMARAVELVRRMDETVAELRALLGF